MFTTLCRVYFGLWLLYAAGVKWFVMGHAVFLGYIHAQFDPTWSPQLLNTVLGWLIIVAEPVLALWLLSGIRQRTAWFCTSLLMFQLTLGMTLLQKPEVIANWQYLVLTIACTALSAPETQN